jgi:hypothetical protein
VKDREEKRVDVVEEMCSSFGIVVRRIIWASVLDGFGRFGSTIRCLV